MALRARRRGFDWRDAPAPRPRPPSYSNTKELGQLLYTDYVYPFEIAAVMLLVAIIAAIALTLRRARTRKHQDPAEQVKVRREDRVRIVTMKPTGDRRDGRRARRKPRGDRR